MGALGFFFFIFIFLPILLIIWGPGLIGRAVGVVILLVPIWLFDDLFLSDVVITPQTTKGMMLSDITIDEYEYRNENFVYGHELVSFIFRNNGDHTITKMTLRIETSECHETSSWIIASRDYDFKAQTAPGHSGRAVSHGVRWRAKRDGPIDGGAIRHHFELIRVVADADA